MPPKKRKASPIAKSAPHGKRVRIGSSSMIGEDEDDASTISASGRPKRSTASDISYSQTRRYSSTKVKPDHPNKKATAIAQPMKRGPGRPRKSTTPASASASTTQAVTQAVTETVAKTIPKGLVGRPLSIATHVEIPVKKRARPPKKVATGTRKTFTTSKPVVKSAPVKKTPGKVGRPERALPAQKLAEDSTGAVVEEAEWENEPEEEIEDERQFWLMKAEPDSRIEKGHDVKFSIDDLMDKTEPEGWDGVRNAVARNNMRAMREGDLAFFYHSNCAIPGIAGIMQIVREHSTDLSAFDPEHPYYDPKSTDPSKPKWELVHVKGLYKFANLVTLKDLKAHMGPGEPLEHLQTLKQSRLSVTSVTPKEWNFIMDISGEEFEEDEEVEQADTGTALEDEADTLTSEQVKSDV